MHPSIFSGNMHELSMLWLGMLIFWKFLLSREYTIPGNSIEPWHAIYAIKRIKTTRVLFTALKCNIWMYHLTLFEINWNKIVKYLLILSNK